jgi:hypothetical protein
VGGGGSWYRGKPLGNHDEDDVAGAKLLLEGLVEVPPALLSSVWAKASCFPCGRRQRCNVGSLLEGAVFGTAEVGF